MAWTAPKTWVASAILTAAELNVHLRDNLNATFPALVSAKGDSVWASGANAGARVAVAASGLLIPDSTCNAGVRWSTCATVNASTGEFRNTAAADVSPFTQARLTVYRDTSNWGYLAYGSDGVLRTVYSSDVGVKSTHWGISNSTSGTGAFTAWMALTTCGVLTIGGSVVNANMTTGLTVNQGAADNEILALKSSDVAHGVTTQTETDTFAYFGKYVGGNGGLLIRTYSMDTTGTRLESVATADETTKSALALANIMLDASKKSGTTVAAHGANANLLAISNVASVKFIFDAEGDLHCDASVNASAFDNFDDAELLRALTVSVPMGGVIPNARDKFLRYNKKHLQSARLATYNDGPGGDGSVFVNVTKLQWLCVGAIEQMSGCIYSLQERNLELAGCLLRLTGSACRV